MNREPTDHPLASNPFSTHRVRPGCLPFHFPARQGIEQLLDTLRLNRWRGQIVGPHGTGKTTLLRTLDNHWHQQERKSITLSLGNQRRQLPSVHWMACDPKTQLIVDGYEQLRWLGRCWLQLRCRSRRCGLLVTTHSIASGMPIICKTTTSLDLVQHLTQNIVDIPIPADRVEACYERADGNVRETFMLLFDAFEAARTPAIFSHRFGVKQIKATRSRNTTELFSDQSRDQKTL